MIIIFGLYTGYQETKIPEHCIDSSTENRATLSAFEVSVSREDTRRNKICFQTKDSNLVQQINQQVQDAELRKHQADLEARAKFWDRYFFPILIAVVLVACFGIYMHYNSGRRY